MFVLICCYGVMIGSKEGEYFSKIEVLFVHSKVKDLDSV